MRWNSLGPWQTLHVDADDLSHSAEARRVAQSIAASLGFDETGQGEAAIVATECATNLARHGGGGVLHLRAIEDEVEIVAVDSGRGMPDVERCLADGYSTAGSAGTGLGAMRRLASVFDIHSVPGRGTAVLVRLRDRRVPRPEPSKFDTGAAWTAAPGELVCGDACAVLVSGSNAWAFMADGLGHGAAASDAAAQAVTAFQSGTEWPVAARLERVHLALRATRGAAIAAARIDSSAQDIEYSGVGNIGGSFRSNESSTGLVSLAGIAGHQVRKIQPFNYRWPAGGLLVLHSDGLQTHWSLDGETGLAHRHPALIAAVLLRNFSRGRDDAMVVVVRERS